MKHILTLLFGSGQQYSWYFLKYALIFCSHFSFTSTVRTLFQTGCCYCFSFSFIVVWRGSSLSASVRVARVRVSPSKICLFWINWRDFSSNFLVNSFHNSYSSEEFELHACKSLQITPGFRGEVHTILTIFSKPNPATF